MPIKILIESWFHIPHSYAIVNCFQCIFWEKYFKDRVELYIHEKPYYREHWNNKRCLVYTEEYNQIIKNLKVAPPDFVPDVVYRATYPYDVTPPKGYSAPVVVFYTAEFAELDRDYFTGDPLLHASAMWFTAPSLWSAKGLNKYLNISPSRNRIITHGVDTTIFKRDLSNREQIRQLYNVASDDILFLNIGAMTQNKGIMELILVLRFLVYSWGGGNKIKLMLKGTGDLYECKAMVEQYMTLLNLGKEGHQLLENNIIFTDKTLTCRRINDLYNACDIYVSPYIAEGFNLTVLEAISAGMRVIVSDNGSTSDFVDNILHNVVGMEKKIKKIQTEVMPMGNAKGSVLKLNLDHFLKLCVEMIGLGDVEPPSELAPFMEKHYSWKTVCEDLLNYFEDIVGSFGK